MCRWLAYSGDPVLLRELLYRPAHSLIDQSLHSRLGAETTNGDGFGLGWYGKPSTPAVFRSVEPAWNERNLRELAEHVTSATVFAHISGLPPAAPCSRPTVIRSGGRWLWMHKGFLGDFGRIKRDLVLEIDPRLYTEIEGSTDSEVFFHLALTYGLEQDPPAAVERAVGFIEEVGRAHGVEQRVQMTVATTDGERIWAFRYASKGPARSLFFSADPRTLQAKYPDNPVIAGLGKDTRLVVSELLGDLTGAWQEIPEGSWCVIQPGPDDLQAFQPKVGRRVGPPPGKPSMQA